MASIKEDGDRTRDLTELKLTSRLNAWEGDEIKINLFMQAEEIGSLKSD